MGFTDKIRHIKKKKFLTAYASTGSIEQACKAAGINRCTHYQWKEADPDYVAALEAIPDQVGDMLEDEAIRRALAGSDTLLIFLLKGFKPARYKENIAIATGEKPLQFSWAKEEPEK